MKIKMWVKRRIWGVEWPPEVSTAKLARELGVSPQLVNKWKKEQTVPDKFVPALRKLNANKVTRIPNG